MQMIMSQLVISEGCHFYYHYFKPGVDAYLTTLKEYM